VPKPSNCNHDHANQTQNCCRLISSFLMKVLIIPCYTNGCNLIVSAAFQCVYTHEHVFTKREHCFSHHVNWNSRALSRHQNVGQNRGIKIANRSFENVSRLKYLGTTVTNLNL
jgi:hypothetical protein